MGWMISKERHGMVLLEDLFRKMIATKAINISETRQTPETKTMTIHDASLPVCPDGVSDCGWICGS